VPSILHEVLGSPGHPLEPSIRAGMEARLGHDFSHVRVHSDEQAAASALAVHALAFTVGQHVVFGSEQYAPSTADGQRLVAHELTHVVQQAATMSEHPTVIGPPDDVHEQHARQVADMLAGSPGRPEPVATGGRYEKQQADGTADEVPQSRKHGATQESGRRGGDDSSPGAWQSAPGTSQGRRLLARELTHFLQQTASSADGHHLPARKAGRPRLTQEPGSVVGQLPRSAHPAFAVLRQVAPVMRRPPFDDQPEELRRVLNASFTAGTFGCRGGGSAADCFNRLETRERIVLLQLFNRFRELGIWAHVRLLTGIWTEGVGGARFAVDNQLFHDLLLGGRMCVDTPLGGMLHSGTSLREVSSASSLHLTLEAVNIAAGKVMSAHIDAVSPVAERLPGGICRYDPTRAAAHIGREVVPLAVPGLQIFPEPRPGVGPPERAETPPELIRFQIRF
jgi:hypothetical protein